MSKILAPVVGMHFRPPAKAILAFLPSGAQLSLQLEPDNPYDANAIRVLVEAKEVPEDLRDALNAQLCGFGHDLESFDAGSPWHLGYIAREHAAELAGPLADAIDNAEVTDAELVNGGTCTWPAQLLFDGSGKPMASIDLEGGEGE